ncbi:hypothetical protein GX563_11270 [Candidatus Bathyarchaeota archaeon]|nr:hypothetical protein [Candidatus Bathyarchaeota archaeon]
MELILVFGKQQRNAAATDLKCVSRGTIGDAARSAANPRVNRNRLIINPST